MTFLIRFFVRVGASFLLSALVFMQVALSAAGVLRWNVVYDGMGSVQVDSTSGTMMLAPKVSTALYETHAALVVSEKALSGNYELVFNYETVEQLRENFEPNPWEMGWLVWGYRDVINVAGEPDQTFNYLILKPNGLEFGEALTQDGQNFLWTSPYAHNVYVPGQTYQVKIRVAQNVLTVWIDGVKAFSYSDTSSRTLSFDGKFGVYAEDASVRVNSIRKARRR